MITYLKYLIIYLQYLQPLYHQLQINHPSPLQVLMPYMNDMMAKHIKFEKYKLTMTYGEYMQVDKGNNGNQASIVVFQRDSRGVWRLVEI